MSLQLSARERLLAALVGGVAFIFLNVFVVSYFLKNQTRLQRELTTRTRAIAAMKQQLAERGVWEEREAWLRAHQPRVSNRDTGGSQLLEHVEKVAAAHAVTTENPGIEPAAGADDLLSISVTMETKSTWRGLVEFMHALQGPEQFIVFESANLQIDSGDQTQMRGRFRIARWSVGASQP